MKREQPKYEDTVDTEDARSGRIGERTVVMACSFLPAHLMKERNYAYRFITLSVRCKEKDRVSRLTEILGVINSPHRAIKIFCGVLFPGHVEGIALQTRRSDWVPNTTYFLKHMFNCFKYETRYCLLPKQMHEVKLVAHKYYPIYSARARTRSRHQLEFKKEATFKGKYVLELSVKKSDPNLFVRLDIPKYTKGDKKETEKEYDLVPSEEQIFSKYKKAIFHKSFDENGMGIIVDHPYPDYIKRLDTHEDNRIPIGAMNSISNAKVQCGIPFVEEQSPILRYLKFTSSDARAITPDCLLEASNTILGIAQYLSSTTKHNKAVVFLGVTGDGFPEPFSIKMEHKDFCTKIKSTLLMTFPEKPYDPQYADKFLTTELIDVFDPITQHYVNQLLSQKILKITITKSFFLEVLSDPKDRGLSGHIFSITRMTPDAIQQVKDKKSVQLGTFSGIQKDLLQVEAKNLFKLDEKSSVYKEVSAALAERKMWQSTIGKNKSQNVINTANKIEPKNFFNQFQKNNSNVAKSDVLNIVGAFLKLPIHHVSMKLPGSDSKSMLTLPVFDVFEASKKMLRDKEQPYTNFHVPEFNIVNTKEIREEKINEGPKIKSITKNEKLKRIIKIFQHNDFGSNEFDRIKLGIWLNQYLSEYDISAIAEEYYGKARFYQLIIASQDDKSIFTIMRAVKVVYKNAISSDSGGLLQKFVSIFTKKKKEPSMLALLCRAAVHRVPISRLPLCSSPIEKINIDSYKMFVNSDITVDSDKLPRYDTPIRKEYGGIKNLFPYPIPPETTTYQQSTTLDLDGDIDVKFCKVVWLPILEPMFEQFTCPKVKIKVKIKQEFKAPKKKVKEITKESGDEQKDEISCTISYANNRTDCWLQCMTPKSSFKVTKYSAEDYFTPDSENRSPFFMFCYGDHDILPDLWNRHETECLKHMTYLDTTNRSPFYWLCHNNKAKKFLQDKFTCLDVNLLGRVDIMHQSPFYMLCRNGLALEDLEKLIKSKSVNYRMLSHLNIHFRSPLYWLCYHGYQYEDLIKNFPQITIEDLGTHLGEDLDPHGLSPFHWLGYHTKVGDPVKGCDPKELSHLISQLAHGFGVSSPGCIQYLKIGNKELPYYVFSEFGKDYVYMDGIVVPYKKLASKQKGKILDSYRFWKQFENGNKDNR